MVFISFFWKGHSLLLRRVCDYCSWRRQSYMPRSTLTTDNTTGVKVRNFILGDRCTIPCRHTRQWEVRRVREPNFRCNLHLFFFEPFGSKFSFEMTKKSAPPQESLFNSLVFLKNGDAFSYCLKLGQFMPQKLLCKK